MINIFIWFNACKFWEIYKNIHVECVETLKLNIITNMKTISRPNMFNQFPAHGTTVEKYSGLEIHWPPMYLSHTRETRKTKLFTTQK